MTSLIALIFMRYNIWMDYEAVFRVTKKCIKIMQYLQFLTSVIVYN